jgi:ribonuclease E
MANKMLIDATHPEETRVTVVRGNRIEEFDFESASRRQLRGNIYLAKVTRVEPSLQAAFVEYGGNRHGFLAFSEIHPDYYQIPVADRQALIEEDERAEQSAEEEEPSNGGRRRRGRSRRAAKDAAPDDKISEAAPAAEDGGETAEISEPAESSNPPAESQADEAGDGEHPEEEEHIEQAGSDDALEEVPERRERRGRVYKIQEVIKRRQVLLIQVVKEERGNKGAALTTYLSLAGRYCVLMPNTARGGGISRKITSAQDRKRLKEIATDLEVPEGMGVILRTAGANRTKTEVKRDFEYLLRMWETVRETTLTSTAPTLVYEEGSLVKRAIRDLYNKDIDEVIVAGETAYKDAKDFMRMLMPSHAKNVQPYREATPIFTKYGVESQLDAMFSPQVTLRSGGYIVINQTEALVAIDVNSGRSTREHNIEDTALKTNLEAAEEVARQLRLRDLAGLIVVDFIDMEENRNNRAVEKKLKDCLADDRARLQIGRISHFGLLEMSRQRIRSGVLESSTETCATCGGAGIVRAVPSVALHVLRMIEEHLLRNTGHNLNVRTRGTVALYVLNQKRAHLRELEDRFGVTVLFSADETLGASVHLVIEKGEPVAERPQGRATAVRIESFAAEVEDEPEIEEAGGSEVEEPVRSSGPRSEDGEDGEEGGGRRRRRRRRRRGGGAGDNGHDAAADTEAATAAPAVGDASEGEETESAEGEDQGDLNGEGRKRRRRGRRGGRRNRREDMNGAPTEAAEANEAEPSTEEPLDEVVQAEPAPEVLAGGIAPVAPEEVAEAASVEQPAAETPVAEDVPAKPVRKRAPRRKKADAAPEAVAAESAPDATLAEPPAPAVAPVPTEPAAASAPEPVAEPESAAEPEKPAGPTRGGWWQRRIFGNS